MTGFEPKRKMKASEALEIVDTFDMPDGATMALAAEMCGLDEDEFYMELLMDEEE